MTFLEILINSVVNELILAGLWVVILRWASRSYPSRIKNDAGELFPNDRQLRETERRERRIAKLEPEARLEDSDPRR